MVRYALVVVWAVLATGCPQPGSVSCGDGSVCAEGKVCDKLHGLCVTEAQTMACGDLSDTDRCSAGDFAGICDQNVCIPGCGDGVREGEECDDGNYESHDGCSSMCTLETASWQRWESIWRPRARHVAAYFAPDQRLVVFGGTDEVGVSDEHWELQGPISSAVWARRDIPRPSARVGASMVYDEVHQKIFLFGGTPDLVPEGAVGSNETWMYDGASWTKLSPAVSPPARWGANMAYAGAGRIVMFGGRTAGQERAFNDTWEFDGTTWVQVASPVALEGRTNAAITWAPFAGDPRVIMVGGQGDFNEVFFDNWKYTTAGGWVETTAPLVVSWRQAAMMTYDPTSQRVVMFGGGLIATPNTDTWSFDGGTWEPYAGDQSPAGRVGGTVTAIGTSALVLVGGRGISGPIDDTWSFRYTTGWRLRASPARVYPHGDAALIFDPDTSATYDLGGTEEPTFTPTSYRFDGETWAPETPLPEARTQFTAAYDSARKHIVIFGGFTQLAPATTQTRTGANGAWTAYAGTEPPARRDGAMAFSAEVGQIVLFGGLDVVGQPLADTWTFDTAWTSRSGSGPAPSVRAAMAYDPDPDNPRTVLFDEAGATWRLTATGWIQIATTGPSPRTAAGMAYSPELSAIVLYGGVENGNTVLQDLWKLVGDEWIEIPLAGERPAARRDPRIVAHRPLRSLVLHAGTAASGPRLDDTWLFQYRSEVPEELCDNGVDDDGDRRIDASDPDCTRSGGP